MFYKWYSIREVMSMTGMSRDHIADALKAGRFGPPTGTPIHLRSFFVRRLGNAGPGATIRIGHSGLNFYLGTPGVPPPDGQASGISARTEGELRRKLDERIPQHD